MIHCSAVMPILTLPSGDGKTIVNSLCVCEIQPNNIEFKLQQCGRESLRCAECINFCKTAMLIRTEPFAGEYLTRNVGIH